MRKTILAASALAAGVIAAGASAQSADTPVDGDVPFRCPVDKIRDAYQRLVNPDDILVALAIEKQTLAICRQSQEALIVIAENENTLEELYAEASPDPAPAPEDPDSGSDGLETGPVESVELADPAPGPLPANGVRVSEGDGPGSESALSDPVDILEAGAAAAEDAPAPTTDYELVATMRDDRGWKTLLRKGEGIYTLRTGEANEDGTRVVSITTRTVKIEDTDGNSFTLE